MIRRVDAYTQEEITVLLAKKEQTPELTNNPNYLFPLDLHISHADPDHYDPDARPMTDDEEESQSAIEVYGVDDITQTAHLPVLDNENEFILTRPGHNRPRSRSPGPRARNLRSPSDIVEMTRRDDEDRKYV